MIENAQEFMQEWEKENNVFYPNEHSWDRLSINQMLLAYEQQKEKFKSHNNEYATALKILHEFILEAGDQDLFGVWLEERLNSQP